MMNSNSILELWEKLEKEKEGNVGSPIMRLYSGAPSRIYSTLQYLDPNHCHYGIAFTFNKDIRIDTSSFDNLRNLEVVMRDDDQIPTDSHLLTIQLLRPDIRDIFATLCEELIRSVIKLNTGDQVSRAVINQMTKWETLFDKINTEMTSAEQKGLFGELLFLQKFLARSGSNPSDVLRSWVGVDKESRDFQDGRWAAEIKTTSTDPRKVIINGERQLDETSLEALFLYHFSCDEEVSNGGQTLCQKIDAIRKSLESDTPALNLFNCKLLEAGYSDSRKESYQNTFYKVRNEKCYKIENDFPRIRKNELRGGVSGVRYSINLATCDKYSVSENQVFDTIESLWMG